MYLEPFCVTLDFKLFIDSIHILFLLYLLLWFWDFNIKNLQDFIKIYRALIKDIFLCYCDNIVEMLNALPGYTIKHVMSFMKSVYGFKLQNEAVGNTVTMLESVVSLHHFSELKSAKSTDAT